MPSTRRWSGWRRTRATSRPVFQLVLTPILALIVAGLAFAVFNAALGGDATFKQVYAIVVHSGAILIVQALFSLPLAYARESLAGATNLASVLSVPGRGLVSRPACWVRSTCS